jgi:uncharacterized protein
MLVVAAVTAVCLLLAWGWYSSGLVLAMPRERISVLPGAFGLGFENVSFAAADGVALKGWFVSSPQGSDATLILCHGRGACRSDILPSTQHLASRGGYNLLYFDFRNHGESGGKATSLGRLESLDLEAALDWLKKERPAKARRVGLFGMSMGGAVAILTAARRTEFAAVAVESAFTSVNRSIVRFARLFYNVPAWAVPYTLWWKRLRLGFDAEKDSPEGFVARISPRPLLLLQGAQDLRMPPSEGERLFALAGEPKTLWTVPDCDHGGLWEAAGKEYEDRLFKFFLNALGAP